MIKIGIAGADTPEAGELLRLLIQHPEIELIFAHAPAQKGVPVFKHHRGLVGDTELRFTEAFPIDKIDLLFVTSEDSMPPDVPLPDNVKVVIVQKNDEFKPIADIDAEEFIPGVSEMFRKPLVRIGRYSRVLPPATSLSLIVLYPLATHLVLNDTLTLKIGLPPYKKESVNVELMTAELESLLEKVQMSFTRFKSVEVDASDTLRALTLEASFESTITVEEIVKMYESIYDDHNFTFLVDTPPSPTEVAGTHKCLIHIGRDESRIKISAVADSVLRGGAGDAIHTMNLLFGLFEKTGLSLPAGLAFND